MFCSTMEKYDVQLTLYTLFGLPIGQLSQPACERLRCLFPSGGMGVVKSMSRASATNFCMLVSSSTARGLELPRYRWIDVAEVMESPNPDNPDEPLRFLKIAPDRLSLAIQAPAAVTPGFRPLPVCEAVR